jgi:BASS family bile acid:Na+ symporter
MLGLGIGLKKQDFQHLFDQPKSLAIGLFAQMVILPLFAFLLVYDANLSPEFKVGVMILSICPGGVTSNLVSYFVKGNVALSVSLTVLNAILTLFTIPILVNVFLGYFFEGSQQFVGVKLPVLGTMVSIFMVTVLPAAIGMLLRVQLGQKRVVKIQKYINIILPVLLVMVFGFKFLGNTGESNDFSTEIGLLTPLTIGLNVGSMLLGFLAGTPFQLSFKNRITIAVEVGLHNTALALLVAGEKLGSSEMEKPALVYAMYSFFVTYLISYLLVRGRYKFLKYKRN